MWKNSKLLRQQGMAAQTRSLNFRGLSWESKASRSIEQDPDWNKQTSDNLHSRQKKKSYDHPQSVKLPVIFQTMWCTCGSTRLAHQPTGLQMAEGRVRMASGLQDVFPSGQISHMSSDPSHEGVGLCYGLPKVPRLGTAVQQTQCPGLSQVT